MTDQPKYRQSFQEILEEQKKKGNYRRLKPGESLRDPEKFAEMMRAVHQDYLHKSAKSLRAVKDKVLR